MLRYLIFVPLLLVGCAADVHLDVEFGHQGAERLVVTLRGEHTDFTQGRTRASFGQQSGIQVHEVNVLSSEHAELVISIPQTEPVGTKTLTVRDGDMVVKKAFVVLALASIAISPNTGSQGTTNLRIAVVGTNTTFTQASLAPQIAITGVSVRSYIVRSATTADVYLDIGLGVTIGTYANAFSVYTGLLNGRKSATFSITVVVGRGITLSPTSARQGEATQVRVYGTKTAFNASSTVSISPTTGVTVSIVSGSVTPTTLDVRVRVSQNAAVLARTLRVTDPYGTLSATLNIVADPLPPSVTFDPTNVMRGAEATIYVTGTNTHFVAGTTQVLLIPSGTGLVISEIDVSAANAIRFKATAAPAATEGYYTITFVTDLETVSGLLRVAAPPPASITLVPNHARQKDRPTVVIEGTNTHFDSATTLVIAKDPFTYGVTVSSFVVNSPTSITAFLAVDDDAPLGMPVTIKVETSSWLEEPMAGFTVDPGIPVVEISPASARQGRSQVTIQATGRFTHWDVITQVLPGTCDVVIGAVTALDAQHLSFLVEVPFAAPIGPCTLTLATGQQAHELVPVDFAVLPAADVIAVPSETPGELDGTGPARYAVVLAAGQTLRARVVRTPATFIDPVLTLRGPDGSFLDDPVAENDDESAATVNPRLVFAASADGFYLLEVRDRLGFNTGTFTLSLAWYAPEGSNVEVGDAPDTTTSAPPLGARVLRGGFVDETDIDVYAATVLPAVERVAVQVIAQDVSPYETSGADVLLELLGSGLLPEPLSTGTEGPDPVLYVQASDLAFIKLTNEGLAHTAYWLNVRPALVINELQHDEATGWLGGFVELFGEPGASLESCVLEGQAFDGAEVHTPFSIALTDQELGPAGYFVLAHDDLVPGASGANIDEGLCITDPTTPYATIRIVLRCGGVVQDAVCYRGNEIPGCGLHAAPDTEAAIGRGFHIDTDDDAADFLPQLEPSPWGRNLTEVR